MCFLNFWKGKNVLQFPSFTGNPRLEINTFPQINLLSVEKHFLLKWLLFADRK